MCFIAIFGKIFRLYLSVLLHVECVSFVVLLSIVLSREVPVDSSFVDDKLPCSVRRQNRELNVVKTLKKIRHFIVQLMNTNYKILRLLK